MKILNYINNLGSGGAEKLLTDVLPIQKCKGHEVAVMISNKSANVKKFEDILAVQDIPVYDLNSSFYNPFQIIKVIRIIRKEQYDIVHAHLFPTQYWLAIASYFLPKKTKLVKTEHAVVNKRQQYKFLNLLEKYIYSRYDVIIAITSLVKNNLIKWLNNDNVVVIHNGVNLQQVEKAKQISKNKSLKVLDEKSFNILMVGRFDGHQKDQNTLIEAITFLGKDVELYFAGEGPDLKNSQRLSETLKVKDRVHFLGMRTDVYELMSSVHLNVLSTNFEGLSGVALESMASGRPFIGSNVGGVMDIVPNESFLFPAQDAKALSDKIKKIMGDDKYQEQLIREATEHVVEYDINFMINKTISLYKEVIAKNI